VKQYTADWNAELNRLGKRPPAAPPSYSKNQAAQWPTSIEI
jgi:hypothetical protein